MNPRPVSRVRSGAVVALCVATLLVPASGAAAVDMTGRWRVTIEKVVMPSVTPRPNGGSACTRDRFGLHPQDTKRENELCVPAPIEPAA